MKVVDFGASKVLGASRITKTGIVFGTPHYMSPEQASGQPVDHRADIYAVGIIMYEMFTGRVPFEADTYMGVLTQHMFVQPRPPRVVRPSSGRELGPLEDIALRALAKRPEDRYQTMNGLAADLERTVPRAEGARERQAQPACEPREASACARSRARWPSDDGASRRCRTSWRWRSDRPSFSASSSVLAVGRVGVLVGAGAHRDRCVPTRAAGARRRPVVADAALASARRLRSHPAAVACRCPVRRPPSLRGAVSPTAILDRPDDRPRGRVRRGSPAAPRVPRSARRATTRCQAQRGAPTLAPLVRTHRHLRRPRAGGRCGSARRDPWATW